MLTQLCLYLNWESIDRWALISTKPIVSPGLDSITMEPCFHCFADVVIFQARDYHCCTDKNLNFVQPWWGSDLHCSSQHWTD